MFLYLGPNIIINTNKIVNVEKNDKNITIYLETKTLTFVDRCDNGESLYSAICKALEKNKLVIGHY